ncbi:MAG TPA: response regulator transcription factor [Candidatus Dormibacteraeota bacterium]|nr:response regulator transcription factor [Candidatus Dormibacteraeota bacterium]
MTSDIPAEGPSPDSALVLVVEDDPDIGSVLQSFCQQLGYRSILVTGGQEAIDRFREAKPSLMLLDLMLPGVSGFEVCRTVRSFDPLTPIIIISARGDTADLVVALDRGADDYLIKPFKLRELEARMATQLRRLDLVKRAGGAAQVAAPMAFGDLVIDLAEHRVSVDGETINLSPLEYRLLEYFAAHAGQVVSRERLLQDVWRYVGEVETRTVDTHVGRLRKKIETDVKQPVHIVSVPGFGYRFERRFREEAPLV